nr:MAG TPA: TOM7 family [Crassvirales sp.]
MVVNGKIGTIKQLHVELSKYVLHYKFIPMIQVELDENEDLEYFASLTNIKKI